MPHVIFTTHNTASSTICCNCIPESQIPAKPTVQFSSAVFALLVLGLMLLSLSSKASLMLLCLNFLTPLAAFHIFLSPCPFSQASAQAVWFIPTLKPLTLLFYPYTYSSLQIASVISMYGQMFVPFTSPECSHPPVTICSDLGNIPFPLS